MLNIVKNEILAPYTTMKIGPAAEFFTIVKNRKDVLEAITWAKANKKKIMILGGGSNTLVTKKIKGLVIKNEIKGLDIVEKNKDYALIEGGSGEIWSKFVNFAVTHDLYGAENLFLIPGTVGAAPVQNIGAYGVELKDIFFHLKAIELKTGAEKIFSLVDCDFSYRSSAFKKELKNQYLILSVTLKLSRTPDWKLDYGSIKENLTLKGIVKPNLKNIIAVIQEIRNSKLPNPATLPNSGSFFQNPIICSIKFKKLLKKYPDIPNWPSGKNEVKLSAGWMIERVGLKGKKFGPLGMYEKQALVLVNYNNASAGQVLNFIKKVKAAVYKEFKITLKEEVNIL